MTQPIPRTNHENANQTLNERSQSNLVANTRKKFSKLSAPIYEGSNYTNLPALSNIFWAPYETISAGIALHRARKIEDIEGQLETSLRLSEQPFSFTSSLISISYNAIKCGLELKITPSHWDKFIIGALPIANVFLGLIVCAIEACFEALGLHQSIKFYSRTNFSLHTAIPEFDQIKNPKEQLEKLTLWLKNTIKNPSQLEKTFENPECGIIIGHLKNILILLESCEKILDTPFFADKIKEYFREFKDKVLLKDLKMIETNFLTVSNRRWEKIDLSIREKFSHLSPSEQEAKKQELAEENALSKKSNLARRVEPWLATEIGENLHDVVDTITNSDPLLKKQGRESAEQLLKDIQIQSQKKLIAHVVGLIALAITMTGLILTLTVCPYLIPAALLFVGGAIAMARYYFALGCGNSRGWNFEVTHCVPELFKFIYQKIFASTPPPAPFPVVRDFRWKRKINHLNIDYFLSVKKHPLRYRLTLPH